MANIRGSVAQSSVSRRTADGGYMDLRCLRDGVLLNANWYDALAMEGRAFCANGGTASSPITFGGAYDADAPDLVVDIPDGTVGIPLYASAHIETSGASMFEIIFIASKTLAAVSSGTSVTIRNMRLDDPVTSVATANAAVAGAGCTDPHTAGNFVEFYRSGVVSDPDADAAAKAHHYWSAKQSGPPPLVIDGGCFAMYVSGTTGTGFCTLIWAEVPENFIK